MTPGDAADRPRKAVAGRRMPLRPAGTFFVFALVGAAAVAVVAGSPAMTWGYIGAFTLTIAIGLGMALRADQHNRAIQDDPPL